MKYKVGDIIYLERIYNSFSRNSEPDSRLMTLEVIRANTSSAYASQ